MSDSQRAVEALFAGWEETLIWSCLQGVMGHVYVNDLQKPVSAMAVLGDFAFLAGTPDERLVRYRPNWYRQDFIIMVPQNAGWAERIESVYREKAMPVVRYAIKKEANIFDTEYLEKIAAGVPAGYSLRMIDRDIYERSKREAWCRDWTSQFESFEKFQELGLGAAILKDGEIVAGASSYSAYREGIEIQIDTREDYRRKGLALACGAKLILECLARGIYPSWDAQNRGSVALAEKLGYHFDREYTAYEIRGYGDAQYVENPGIPQEIVFDKRRS